MSTRRSGLGRGLEALLGDQPKAGVAEVPTARVFPNPHQPRRTFDPAALDELRASIAELGVLVPIIVRPRGKEYELIAGERRWRAATAAGLVAIPAIVREADDRESMELAIVENLQREDLDPLEEAMGFQYLVETFGFTQDRIAERIGRSRPAVSNALRLLTLSDPIKAHLRAGALSPGHARALLALPESEREQAAERAAKNGASVRSLESLAQQKRERPQRRAAAPSEDEAVIERLRYRFGAPVAIKRRGRAGVVEIRYADAADLVRIVDVLLGDQGE